MATTVIELPVHGTKSDEFERYARTYDVPHPADATDLAFTPAFGGFTIGEGRKVDISHLYIPASPDPLGIPQHRPLHDRHLDSEEVWVITKGDVIMGMAEAEHDPLAIPSVNDLRLFLLKEGDVIVLPAGRWHAGIWGASPNKPSEFLMLLSGHRAADDGQLVDHIMEPYAEDVSVLPERESVAALQAEVS